MAQLVAHQAADDVRHDQADKRNIADRYDHQRRNQRHNNQPRPQNRRPVQPQVHAHRFAQTQNRQLVGNQIGKQSQNPRCPQQFIPPEQHAGKIALLPHAQHLQHFVFIRDKGGHRLNHPAENNPDQRHHQLRGRRQAADQQHKDQHPDQRGNGGNRHFCQQRRSRQQQGHQQQTQSRALACAHHRRFDKTVAHQNLHNHAGHGHRRACQHNGKRARQAADEHNLLAVRERKQGGPVELGDPDRQADGKQYQKRDAVDKVQIKGLVKHKR